MKILYIEDAKHMALAISQVLKKSKYDVDLAHDGESGLDLALTGIYDIIILDVMLPKIDGISVLRSIRKNGVASPVLLLTALGEISDRVRGLDTGADDYLTKPFSGEELLARLRALGRRVHGEGTSAEDSVITFGDLKLDYGRLDLTCNGKTFHLMPKEARLLEMLIRRHDCLVPNNSIIEKLWNWDADANESHIQVQISFIRKKLAALGSSVKIKTIYAAGYMIVNEG